MDRVSFFNLVVFMSYELRATSYELRVMSYELRVTSYELRVTSFELRVTSYKLRVTSYQEGVFRILLIRNSVCFFIIPYSIRNWPKFHGIMQNSL